VLQCVAVCCNVLQCVAAWCSVAAISSMGWQRVAECSSVMCCRVLQRGLLQCVAVWCIDLQCGAVCCSEFMCGSMRAVTHV